MQKKKQRKYLSIFLTGLLVVSTVAFTGAFSGVAQTSDDTTDGDWATARADHGRTGATTGSGPTGPYADTDWSDNPDGRPSGAVVKGNTVYLGVETFTEYNRKNGKVVAYDAHTGSVRWNRTDLGGVDESPTVSDGTVYVTANGVTGTDNVLEESGTPGLFALDAETGETKWRNNATKTWTGTPTVVGDTVYVLGSRDTVYAIDVETGETKDSYTIETETNDSTNTSVYVSITDYAVVDNTAYLSVKKQTTTRTKVDGDWKYEDSYSGRLVALNTSNWSHEWTADADSVPSGLAVTDGTVYWTVQPDRVYTFSAGDGTPRWQRQLDNGVDDSDPDLITAPAVSDGTVYVGTDDDYTNDGSEGQEVGAVHALDSQNGHEQWRFETAADVDSAPTVTADTVYVGGDYPTQHDAEENIDGHPSEAVDSIYSHQAVYALNRNDGSEKWSYAMDGEAADSSVGATVPANGHLYVWTTNDDTYPQWSYSYSFYALNASEERSDKYHRLANDEPQTQDEKPVAQITTEPEGADTIEFGWDAEVTLNASSSGDSDGRIVTYRWDIDEDGTYERAGETLDVTTEWCGERTVTLKVTDDDGNVDTASIPLTTDCTPTRDGATDDDWSQVRNDPAQTGSTENAGPSEPYADEVWNKNVDGAAGAVISDDTVYVGSTTYTEYNQKNGQVVAYNATTGGFLWERTDLGEVRTAPIVVGDTVFVGAIGVSYDNPNPDTGTAGLFALDAETGETKWHRDGNRPVYADDHLYVATEDGTEAVNPQSGVTVWTAPDVRGSMSVADGSVYVLNDTEGRIISLDADAGTEQWNTTLPVDEDDVSGYAISNGVIYLTANPDTVYALSADDGSALWTKTAEHSMADSTIDEISAPAVANGVVYVGTDDDYEWNKPENSEEMGAVHAFGGQTGEEVWRFETAADIQGPPTVADGQVYIGGEYASQDAWEDESKYSDHPSDLVGTVYSSNVVYALDADSGDESWSYAVSRYTNDKRVRGIAVANGDVYAWTDDDATYYPSGELFALTSSDERPNSDERLADDSLYEQNSRPIATIETEPPNADEKEFEGGETVSLDASNSTDSDGEIVSYEWDLDGDGEFETTGTTAEVTVPDCEILEVTLRVTDDDGGVGTGSAELRGK